jgi:hypothetical protein
LEGVNIVYCCSAKLLKQLLLGREMILTALFDTNIYGILIADRKNGSRLIEKIKQDPNFVIHNFRLIRKELGKAPKEILPVYNKLVANRVIEESKQINNLAKEYFKEYKANGGVKKQKKILNDFKIVACSTLLNCDIVASEDKKTMLHPIAIKSYKNVNMRIGRTPTFFTYTDLKRKYYIF